MISGDEEARLTFLGATAGRGGDEPVLVVDIGGGSTEFVIGVPGSAPGFHVSTRLGSVRQSERHLASDPPEHAETEALGRAAREIVAEGVPEPSASGSPPGSPWPAPPRRWPRSTSSSCPYDPARVDGYRLGLADCERMLALLASMPLAERREVPGLHPDRAPTIVAGAAILVESLRSFGLQDVRGTRSRHPPRRRIGRFVQRGATMRQALDHFGVALSRHRVGYYHRCWVRGSCLQPSHKGPVHRFGRSRIVSAPPAVRTARLFQGTYPCPS